MLDSINVLYVEDEQIVRDAVISLFENIFNELYVSVDGEDGLDTYEKNMDKIDIIITDINMPKIDGLEMSKKIREIDKKIPIIITTAHDQKDFLLKAIDIGISGFVTKPMDMNRLHQTVLRVIQPILLQRKLDNEIKARETERVQAAKFTAIGQLSAGITHEINTPLTYMKASFEMLECLLQPCQENQDMLDQNIQRVKDGITRIENIVNSMKEMCNQSTTVKENINIYSTLITSLILTHNKSKHISQVYINGKEFDSSLDKNENSFFALANRQKIEQVWIIIINNAMDELMKISEFSKRRLDIDVSQDDESVTVTFKDNAGGIDEDIRQELFAPFKGTKESSGMGIGLSIAKMILEHHKGSIDAYNEDDGAVFKVCLSKSE